MTEINHGVSDAFLAHLNHLTQEKSGTWWQDVLLRDDLFIAIRRNSLNVYYRGGSLYRIDDKGDGTPRPYTHVKYLVRQQQALAELVDGVFKPPMDGKSKQPKEIVWKEYESDKTLRDMIRSASDLAGVEKAGLHPLIIGNDRVIDVEVSLKRNGEAESIEAEDKKERDQDRLDVTTLERQKEAIMVVFHEAKHFTNPALRAKEPNEPDVIRQLKDYQKAIADHRPPLIERYKATCQAHQKLDAMRQHVRAKHGKPTKELNPLIREVAAGTAKLIIDPNPRLVIFGFDADQRDHRLDRNERALKDAARERLGVDLSIDKIGTPTFATRAFPLPAISRGKKITPEISS